VPGAPILPFIRESEFAVRSPWSLAERRLLDYLIVYVEAGECALFLDGLPIELRRGDFALIQPGERHSIEAAVDTTTPYAHLDIFYNPRREESFAVPDGQLDLSDYPHLIQPRLDDALGVRVPTHFRPRQTTRFRSAFLRMVGLWQSTDPVDRLEAQMLATELVVHLLRDFSPRRKDWPGVERFGWVTSYLSLRLAEPVSVSDLANRAHLSPSQFAAQFRRQFGVPPHQYLTRLRVEHAQSLLSTSDRPIAEVAGMCGFADSAHFTKAFKRVAGTTPGAYRRTRSAEVS
jgi:AraC-like DNA-binding protein